MTLLKFLLPLIACLAVYSVWIEPFWIEVTHHAIEAPVKTPIKIVQLTDLHLTKIGRRERRVLKIIAEEKPDAIVVTGDSIRYNATYGPTWAFYRMLKAPLGVWVVRGNWENAMPLRHVGTGDKPGPTDLSEETFYDSTGVRLLDNAAGRLTDDIWLIGVDEFSRGRPDFDRAASGVPATAYRVVLTHAPEYFDLIAGRFDLLLAGHTHGGQVRIPGFPPAYCPAGCGRYLSGWYEKAGSKMYVSRGIGTSILAVRFNSRPEVAVFTIAPAR